MDILLEPQKTTSKKLINKFYYADSFTNALAFVNSNDNENAGLCFIGSFTLTQPEKNSLKLLPKAFDSNRTIQKLRLKCVNIDNILVAEALRAGIRKDDVNLMEFFSCKKVDNQIHMETMSQGLKEKSTPFDLMLHYCSSDFVKPLIEASYLNCASLEVSDMNCVEMRNSLKHIFSRGTLVSISLNWLRGLKDNVFIDFARCVSMLPNLTKLDLFATPIPTAALKRLHGSMKMILGSERSNISEQLILTSSNMEDKLIFAYFGLLRTDFVGCFIFKVKEDASKAVVKSVSANVANTKNLTYLNTEKKFLTDTTFKNFVLQAGKRVFRSPFQVNPKTK